MQAEITSVIDTAKRFEGTMELSGNRGVLPDFCNWLHSGGDWRQYPLGLQGAPWCSTFLMTMGRLALGDRWPYPMKPEVSSVQWVAKQAKEIEIIGDRPEVGDFLCVSKGIDYWGHIALVTGVSGDTVRTIEGNTNNSGSSEGVGVYVLSRLYKPADRLVRWVNLL